MFKPKHLESADRDFNEVTATAIDPSAFDKHVMIVDISI
jgi:hypothetical protein